MGLSHNMFHHAGKKILHIGAHLEYFYSLLRS